MKPHEYIPPEAWDEFFKPRGPLGLFSGRTALSFVPGVSQSLDYMDTRQAIREGDTLGTVGGLFGMATGPLGRAGKPVSEIIGGPKARGYVKELGDKALARFMKDPENTSAVQKLGSQNALEGYFTLPDVGSKGKRVPVFEISDKHYRVRPEGVKLLASDVREFPLPDIIEHPELFKNYPELQDYKVIVDDEAAPAFIDLKDRVIHVESGLPEDELGHYILHELQHAVAEPEWFDPGFGRWRWWKEEAIKAGKTEEEADDIMSAMHEMQLGENTAELVARKWSRIDQQTRIDPDTMEPLSDQARNARRAELYDRYDKPVTGKISGPRNFNEAGTLETFADEQFAFDELMWGNSDLYSIMSEVAARKKARK